MMENKVSAIDFLKLWFAIGIMGLHTNVLNVFNSSVQYYVTRLWFREGFLSFLLLLGIFLKKNY